MGLPSAPDLALDKDVALSSVLIRHSANSQPYKLVRPPPSGSSAVCACARSSSASASTRCAHATAICRLQSNAAHRLASLTPSHRCRMHRATPARARLGLPSAGCKVECRRRPAMALSQPPISLPLPLFFCTGGHGGGGGSRERATVGFFYIF